MSCHWHRVHNNIFEQLQKGKSYSMQNGDAMQKK
jgi:hypothetical protein